MAFARWVADPDLRLDEIAEILALRDPGKRPCDYVLEVARRRFDEPCSACEELATLIARAPSPSPPATTATAN